MSWRAVGGAVGALALAGGAFFGGMKYGVQTTRAEQAEQRAAASDDVLRKVSALAVAANDAAASYAQASAQIQTHTTTIIREVPRVLTPELDRRYPLPWGLVRLHDEAATGLVLPEAPGEPDGEASTVAPSTLASLVAVNYGACRETSERLTALQQWAETVSETGSDR